MQQQQTFNQIIKEEAEDLSQNEQYSYCSNSHSIMYECEDEDIDENQISNELFFSYSSLMKEFDDMDLDDLASNYSQCNKSNYVKNILNQFTDYINISGDQVVIESISDTETRNLTQIRKEFNCFMKHKQLNQALLVSILKSKRFAVQFQYFLNYYTKEWVLRNHLKNIRLHILCICFMKRCFKEPSLIDNIKIYKKRN